MAKSRESLVLIGELRETRSILVDLYQKHELYRTGALRALGKVPVTASYLSDLLDSIYTCLETLFLRISHFFENELEKERWHQDLLDKMTIEVPGVRVAVLSGPSRQLLQELLRFRHFRRYYFEMEYDWDKLDYLQKKLLELKSPLETDLNRFLGFLEEL